MAEPRRPEKGSYKTPYKIACGLASHPEFSGYSSFIDNNHMKALSMIRFYLTTLALVLNMIASAFCILALYDYGFGYSFAWMLCVSLGFMALAASALLRIADQIDQADAELVQAHELTPIQVRLDKSWMAQG